MDLQMPLFAVFAAISGIGVYSAAVALGFRHGIDWDHIAAITDITSATAGTVDEEESWLMGEPGVQLTDESHHLSHDGHEHSHGGVRHEHSAGGGASQSTAVEGSRGGGVVTAAPPVSIGTIEISRDHVASFWLGTLYALGHGSVVFALGMIAILAAEILPDWVDPVMERIVGVTLIFLSAYLFFSVYQYFRGGREFRIRSRWMIVFAGVANAWSWIRSHFGEHEHRHVMPQQYSGRTAFAIGMIHGVGAETGTQALIIATAVGATSKSIAVLTLLFFLVGLLISNSFVTLMTTVGFVSARRRQLIYVGAGLVAAVFSLLVGSFFLLKSADLLPELDRYVRWVGGPK
jgi:high-affinity nickel-transport protein